MMEAQEKTERPPGPWNDEPDRVSWRDDETGLDCLMKRHPEALHWCGYVAAPSGHPWHGKGWEDIPAEPHGGVTYAQPCDGDPLNGICHVPVADEDDVWWIGFDCAHAGDWSPGDRFPVKMQYAVYRDAEYVRAEVLKLAKEVKARA